jgi:uncharacterized protein with GYD domain
MNSNPVRESFQISASLAVLCVMSVTLLANHAAFAQAGSKDAQKFQSLVDDTRTDIGKASAQFDVTMAAYNAIVNAEAENPEKAFKSLKKDIDKSEKVWKTAGSSFDKMQKAGKKLFSGWQKEVDAYTNEQMKQLSVGRLEEASARNQQMIERVTAVQDVYEPFISSLKDQALFMGRDMSPEAMAALAPMAEELNANAATLQASIDVLLNGDAEMVDEEPAVADETAEVVDVEEVGESAVGDETEF